MSSNSRPAGQQRKRVHPATRITRRARRMVASSPVRTAKSLVIVSNRLPISVKKTDGKIEYFPSVGGLATGLASYASDKRNKWIGWPGIPSDDLLPGEEEQIAEELARHNCYPVFLKQKQLDNYYNGYSNSILWPLFHDLPAQYDRHDEYWKAYKSVNAAFAEVVLALSDPYSTIWVHDYQLLLLPSLLRSVRPRDKIGFFLHIPFPALKHFKALPSGRELLLGMLGSDLMGFHTRAYVDNFVRVVHELTDEIVENNQVLMGSHIARAVDFPMGIDYERFTRARDLTAVKQELRKHQRKYKGLKVILTVDRLDPTKGLAERLEAYYEFLRRSPDLHGKVVMAMLAVPSRTEIDEYKKLKTRVEGLVEQINSEFGTSSWQPVDYMYTSMSVESVTALYQVADVAFITPLRDGMNLVAKEYIASKPKQDGVLILSSTAGAAQELTDALLVNPRKRESLVGGLTDALTMPKTELKQRVSAMHDQISTNTVQFWAGNFMKNLQKPVPGTRHITRGITRSRELELAELYRIAKNPLLLLDYDGVLAPFVSDPRKAAPSKSIYKLLEKLSEHPGGNVAIVSGRGRVDLEAWLGDLPLHLVSEHGALMRKAGNKNWKKMSNSDPDWQHELEPLLERYAAETPGAHVEIKQYALVWHYRGASPYYAQKNGVILRRLLRPLARKYGLEVDNGNKIIEIKPGDINKGSAVERFLGSNPDFILCIGDDYTDEDMFEVLPAHAHTIKVGRGRTAARYRVQSTEDVQRLLKRLAR